MSWKRFERSGFTLAEVVIAVAIVALLIGASVPLVYRQLEGAREEATTKELAALRHGLLRFYQDTGRFPTAGEGLLALATDPGVVGWSGPYVGGEGFEDEEILADAWGRPYAYDPSPVTVPAGAADVLVASTGRDDQLQAGGVGLTWDLTAQGDDLLTMVNSGPTDRGHIVACRDELARIGEAAARYYADHSEFPDDTSDLLGSYLPDDPALFSDPWFKTIAMAVQDNGTYPPDLVLTSGGPDQAAGGGDDILLTVSALSPGRSVTMKKVRTAQQALTGDPLLALAGTWEGTDRQALQLAADLDQDGWGRPLQINPQARLVFSMGPDGLAETVDDNIPSGIGFTLGGGGGGGGEDDAGDDGDDGGSDDGAGDDGDDGNGNGNGNGDGGNGNGDGGGNGNGDGGGNGNGNNGNGNGNGGGDGSNGGGNGNGGGDGSNGGGNGNGNNGNGNGNGGGDGSNGGGNGNGNGWGDGGRWGDDDGGDSDDDHDNGWGNDDRGDDDDEDDEDDEDDGDDDDDDDDDGGNGNGNNGNGRGNGRG